jgi:hypothetical protein
MLRAKPVAGLKVIDPAVQLGCPLVVGSTSVLDVVPDVPGWERSSGVVRDDGVMVWGVDDFGAWLVGQLADASRRRLTELILGGKFEQALRQVGAAAGWAAASELSPGDPDRAAHLARVLNEVFAVQVPDAAAAGATVLEVIQAGVVAQVVVLGDPCLTTVAGVSSAAEQLAGSRPNRMIRNGVYIPSPTHEYSIRKFELGIGSLSVMVPRQC